MTPRKEAEVARRPAKRKPLTPYINIRVLRTTNQRIRLAAAKNNCTVPEMIDRTFATE